MQRNIWIVKDMGHDLTSVIGRGQINFVFERDFSPFRLREARERIARVFEDCPPQAGDFLLFVGPTSLNVVLALALAERIGDFRCLVYHAKHKMYAVRDILSASEAAS